MQLLSSYLPQNLLGWFLIVAGFGVLSTIDEKSSRAAYVRCQIPVAVWISTQFPILARLLLSNSAHALSFFAFKFVRCFAQNIQADHGASSWRDDPAEHAPGHAPAFLHRTLLAGRPDRGHYSQTRLTWRVMIRVSGVGSLSPVALMRKVQLREDKDAQRALQDDEGKKEERGVTGYHHSFGGA
ncbi:hypothetical protein V8D89_001603 [Ganoderma adspersum]